MCHIFTLKVAGALVDAWWMTSDPRFSAYGTYDPHAQLVAELRAERDALVAQNKLLRGQVRRANITGVVVLVLWLASGLVTVVRLAGA